ncbi:MAG: hypothetical protein JSV36_16130 [Anaerolineae bacterium]|nr:MAG: hypothetical protein JSV36_16130 [Anaerolineae bacterium]
MHEALDRRRVGGDGPVGLSVVTLSMLATPIVQGAPHTESLKPLPFERPLTVKMPPTPMALVEFFPNGIGRYAPQPGKRMHIFMCPSGTAVFIDPSGGPPESPLNVTLPSLSPVALSVTSVRFSGSVSGMVSGTLLPPV